MINICVKMNVIMKSLVTYQSKNAFLTYCFFIMYHAKIII